MTNKNSTIKYTKNVIKKTIELILLGEDIKNKSINKIMNNINQQSIEVNSIRNQLYSSSISFEEIYKNLTSFNSEIIPVIIATIIKDNIDYVVIEKSGEEQHITYKTIEDINNNPSLYTLIYINEHKKFDEYKCIFNCENKDSNIFYNIVDEMQMWFFSLNKYATICAKEYIGKGKYKRVPETIIRFKNSLRGIQNNPYFYLNEKLPGIFKKSVNKQLKQSKLYIDGTMERLKKTLGEDIDYVFSETIDVWYKNLSEDIKKRVFNDGEEKFLLLCKNKSKDNNFIEHIAEHLTGINIDNWENNIPAQFYDRLIKTKNSIESNVSKNIKNGFVINYINGDNKSSKILEIPKDINKNIEKIMMNDLKSLFNDYGNSVNHSAKIALALKAALEEESYYDIL